MSTPSEIDESMMFDNNIDSPTDEESNSRDNVGRNGPLKKGPWTSGEDAILVEYVTKNGEGNWNAVQKHSGLARCGKSCRLRWTNHLRPNLKKCAFSPEEEQLVIELHSKMGNKWAKMATELPGRTDNEIKNFWNTRVKRLQRAGIPIYPPELCSQPQNDETQESNDMATTFPSHDAYYPNLIPFDKFEFQTVEFKGLKVDDDVYPTSALLDMPSSSGLIPQGLPSIMLPSNCFRGSDIGQIGQIGQPFVYSSSSSGPNWATKVELPSLQTQMCSRWVPPSSSPLCSFESVDIPIQTTPSTENTVSYNNASPLSSGLLDAVPYESSPLSSGLLDAVPYESQTINSLFSHASNVGVDLRDTLSRDFYKEAYGEQMSCSSIFSEGTAISRSSFDDPEYVQRGCKVKGEATFVDPMQYCNKGSESTNEMIWSPDMLLADCFSPNQFNYW